MSAGSFGPTLTSGKTLAATSFATVTHKSAQAVVTNRNGANGVGDNQRLQTIAEALGRGDVTEATINA